MFVISRNPGYKDVILGYIQIQFSLSSTEGKECNTGDYVNSQHDADLSLGDTTKRTREILRAVFNYAFDGDGFATSRINIQVN